MHELYEPLLRSIATKQHIVLGYSGGRDSAVLLHALLNVLKPEQTLTVCHINHGLQEIALDWEEHVKRLPVIYKDLHSFNTVIQRVQVTTGPQLSIEDEARKARYKALEQCVEDVQGDCLLLAHHMRDQAETFLLQAFRGSGVRGLSSMPAQHVFHGIDRIRPWLNVPYEAIQSYSTLHNIAHIEDPSNDDPKFTRNFVRHSILPLLRAKHSGVETALAHSAKYCAEATEAMDWMATEDLKLLLKERDLNTAIISDWPAWRAKNVVQAWYSSITGSKLSGAMLENTVAGLQEPVFQCDLSNKARLVLSNGYLQLTSIVLKNQALNTTIKIVVTESTFEHDTHWWKWSGPLPTTLEYGPRRAGDKMSIGQGRPNRPLKKLFQDLGVSEALRGGCSWYHNDILLYHPVLGVNYNAPNQLTLSLDVRSEMNTSEP